MTAHLYALPPVAAGMCELQVPAAAPSRPDDVLRRVRDAAAPAGEVCEVCGVRGDRLDDVYPTPCGGLTGCELDRENHERSCLECRAIAREDAAADLAEDDALDLDRCGL